MPFDFKNDDIEDNHYNFKYGYLDGVSPLKNDATNRPTVSYLYIDMGTTKYNFNQKDFGKRESKEYLKKMNKYAQTPLQDLIDNSEHEEHFRISTNLSKNEKELLKEHIGVPIKEENSPIIGHFALYTEKYEEGKKTKCPRIFFLVGEQAIMHVLFFDPYHEIHPMSESTKKNLK